jgi:hypothetical protein
MWATTPHLIAGMVAIANARAIPADLKALIEKRQLLVFSPN